MVGSRATADVRRFSIRTRLIRLRGRLQDFARDVLSTTCLNCLATSVRVCRLRAILRVFFLRRIRHFRRFAKYRSRLTNVSSTFFPFTASAKDRFGTGASVEFRLRLLHRLNGGVRLVGFLCGGGGTFTRFLYRRYRFGRTLILVSIAGRRKAQIYVSPCRDVRLQL